MYCVIKLLRPFPFRSRGSEGTCASELGQAGGQGEEEQI
jgi:hypothetical protein